MRYPVLLSIIIILIYLFLPPKSESGLVSQAGMLFLKLPVGAVSSGMGDAFTAIADDASAVWWNPAGLAFLQMTEASYMNCKWLPQFNLPDLRLRNLSVIHNFPEFGTFGLNVDMLDYGTVQRTSAIGTDLGTHRAYDLAVTGAYGTKFTDNLAFGIAAKYIYCRNSPYEYGAEGMYPMDFWAYGFDISMLYKYEVKRLTDAVLARPLRLQFGSNLSNIGPQIKGGNGYIPKPLPTSLRAGFALIYECSKSFKYTFTYEIQKELVTQHEDGSYDPVYQALTTSWYNNGGFLSSDERREIVRHYGSEVWLMGILGLRHGYYNDLIGKVECKTKGLSLQYMFLRFDYSYYSAGNNHPLDQTSKAQITVFFDPNNPINLTPWKKKNRPN